MIVRVIIFLLLNFAALYIGAFFTTDGVSSDWYANLNKAPWTPPGWVFGAAWTLIMICFSVFMAYLYDIVADKKILLSAYVVQLILNISWNPVFFKFHQVLLGLIVISSLLFLVGYFLFNYKDVMKAKSWLIAPYFIWLIIATSLNAYILFMN